MNKIYWVIALLLCFLVFQVSSFDKRVSKRKTAVSATQKTKLKTQKKIFSKDIEPRQHSVNDFKSLEVETASPQVKAQQPVSDPKFEQIQKFDSLNEIDSEMHVEFAPVENIAVSQDKLTPQEQEQYELSLKEINKVKAEGKLITAPPKKDTEDEH